MAMDKGRANLADFAWNQEWMMGPGASLPAEPGHLNKRCLNEDLERCQVNQPEAQHVRVGQEQRLSQQQRSVQVSRHQGKQSANIAMYLALDVGSPEQVALDSRLAEDAHQLTRAGISGRNEVLRVLQATENLASGESIFAEALFMTSWPRSMSLTSRDMDAFLNDLSKNDPKLSGQFHSDRPIPTNGCDCGIRIGKRRGGCRDGRGGKDEQIRLEVSPIPTEMSR